MSEDIFLSQLDRGEILPLMGRARNAAKCSIMHRTAPPQQRIIRPNVNSSQETLTYIHMYIYL